MRIDIQSDVKAVNRDIGFAVPAMSRLATVTALNKTNSKIGTRFRRNLAKQSGLAQKHFKKKVKNYRATRRKPSAKTYIGLRSSIPMSKVVSGPTGKYDKLARKSLEGRSGADAFNATVGDGHNGLFIRTKKADNKAGRDKNGKLKRGRLPITEVRLRLDLIAPKALERAGDDVGPAEFRKQYAYDMKRRLAKSASQRARGRRR